MNKILTYIRRLPRGYKIAAAIIVVILAVLIYLHVTTKTVQPADASDGLSHVQISSIASLSAQSGPLPVTGKVTSLNEANILAQTSGEITSLSHKLGDRVSAGGIIAQFENSSQRAAVLQAQGAYDAAQASLAKVSGTTASNSTTNLQQANQNIATAQASAQTALQSSYAALDDAVHSKADALFSNPRTNTPQLNLSVPDNQLVINLQNDRPLLEVKLSDAETLSTSNPADVTASLNAMIQHAQDISAFLNDLITAINKAVPSNTVSSATIAADLSSVSAGRSEVVASISTMISAKASYASAVSAATTAGNTASGGTTSDISSAQAQVKQAQGALDAAEANLEKTIVRSPISGTIVSLPVTRGDFVASFAQIADISNPQALQVKAYVTSDDAKTIAIGGAVSIDGNTSGVVTSIAPAIDPSTNKIEVDIGVTGDQSDLTDGETVTLAIDRVNTKTATQAKPSTAITIPIVAVKITPAGSVVFTVASSTLVAHPVTLGAILADQVTILSGVTTDMAIVSDARGLSDGQTVVVDTE